MAGPVRSAYVTVHVRTLVSVLNVASAFPEAGLALGGTSLVPLRSAFRATVSACAGGMQFGRPTSIAIAAIRYLAVFMLPSGNDANRTITPDAAGNFN